VIAYRPAGLRGLGMAAEEERGFVIRDRRGRGEDHDVSAGPDAAVSSPSRAARSGASPGSSDVPEPSAPVTFSSFVFSLGTSALMLMGEQLDPQQGRLPVNLSQAKEIIDILSMLEAKTQGNLTGEEQTVLKDMLYALRMKYVDLASGKQASQAS
jgi:hypothetical protein